MSHQVNDIYIESAKEKFDELVTMGDWGGVNTLTNKLADDGFGDLEIKLKESLTDDEIKDYKRWDLLVNGDMETQMDDNS